MIESVINGLEDVRRFFDELPDVAEDAAVFAINDVVVGEGMVAIRREMREQIDFPAGYLEAGRLRVGKRARRGTLEASIRGRDRATSLARFAGGQTSANTRGRGVQVKVKRGQTRVLRKGFIVDLKNGNRGVAVRLKPGESMRNSDKAVRLDDNVYLLYGPSVDQVFKGVAVDVAPQMTVALSRRFFHHFTRFARG
jgi:hypothetical protein